jgi:hypothetical protein
MKSPSRYAGIAAVFVFGTGLLIVGQTWSGIQALGVGTFALSLALSPTAQGKALVIAIGALIYSALLFYWAGSNEMTGRATHYHWKDLVYQAEPVTRQDSPAKFREAANLKWGLGIFCALVSAGGFMFYRKSGAAEDYF